MLAIDTNLIVRYLVNDDRAQAAQARKLIENNDVFVCTTVLLETEWVLRGVYGFSVAQCAKALSGFAGLSNVRLEDGVAAAKALDWSRQGVDFADGLHLAKAEGCDAFVSLDRDFVKAASRLPGITVRTP